MIFKEWFEKNFKVDLPEDFDPEALKCMEVVGRAAWAYQQKKIDTIGSEYFKCEHCNNKRSSTTFRANPFTEEIHGKIENEWICDDCFYELSMDI